MTNDEWNELWDDNNKDKHRQQIVYLASCSFSHHFLCVIPLCID